MRTWAAVGTSRDVGDVVGGRGRCCCRGMLWADKRKRDDTVSGVDVFNHVAHLRIATHPVVRLGGASGTKPISHNTHTDKSTAADLGVAKSRILMLFSCGGAEEAVSRGRTRGVHRVEGGE